MQIEQAKTEELVPYANNANIHTDEQIDQIVASIEEFGFNDPVGVWTNKDGQLEIVEGHGRVLAAKRLGIEELPIIKLDDLTDEQRRAYTHVHNQLTRNSEFDFDILDHEISVLDFDWDALGMDQMDIKFADFNGFGDGGGSQLAQGDKVRIVLGALIMDIDDPTHEIYAKTKELNPDDVGAYLADAIINDRMVR